MNLQQLLDSRMLVEIVGEKEQEYPDMYKAAGISRSVFNRWRQKAELDNPTGLYAKLKLQIAEATAIRKGKALARVKQYAKEVTITKVRTTPDGKETTTVIKRPDVNAGLFILQAENPELNLKASFSQAQIDLEVERRMKQLTETPQLPVIPVDTLDTETDTDSNK